MSNNPFAIQHAKSLACLYRVIDKTINDLEEFLLCDELNEAQLKKWERVYGNKETVVSIAVKLVSMLGKIIPMEQKVMAVIDNSRKKKVQDISKEDIEIIKRYLEKVRNVASNEPENTLLETKVKKEITLT